MKRLLIRPGAIGDCIVSLPALETLHAEETEVWVATQNVPLIRFADRVRSIASTGLDWIGIEGVPTPEPLLVSLRAFDSIISWYGANRQEFRDGVRELGLPFQFCPALPEGGNRHATDFYLDQARQLGGCPADPVPQIPCHATPGDYCVIQPFSGSARKNWPLGNFRAVAAAVAERMPVCWCAGPEEELPEAHRFDDLYELANWLAAARLYIGNDSGVSHLAAAVGTATVAVFGPSEPDVWAPRGPGVHVLSPEGPAPWPSVEAVERAALRLTSAVLPS